MATPLAVLGLQMLPTGVYTVRMEPALKCKAMEAGDPRENPPNSGIDLHDSYIRKPGSVPAADWTQAAAAERLACSPPTKASRVQFPAGSLQVFASRDRAVRCRWSAGSLGYLPFPHPFHSGAASYSSHFTLIGSRDVFVKSRSNPFTPVHETSNVKMSRKTSWAASVTSLSGVRRLHQCKGKEQCCSLGTEHTQFAKLVLAVCSADCAMSCAGSGGRKDNGQHSPTDRAQRLTRQVGHDVNAFPPNYPDLGLHPRGRLQPPPWFDVIVFPIIVHKEITGIMSSVDGNADGWWALIGSQLAIHEMQVSITENSCHNGTIVRGIAITTALSNEDPDNSTHIFDEDSVDTLPECEPSLPPHTLCAFTVDSTTNYWKTYPLSPGAATTSTALPAEA
ncbi:hypothetical protein PR048_020916 [Dryococelus australis]|uniref:Uncharacterized protein n=1 Tax=Dryococelus australis TaxID=614101 RepID=A0ABQ9GWU8_9NEOP|nr:hypothetical protein PR048_020916 [Dryococelus australis]